MEKRFFINSSNTKWIGVGLVPASRILSPEANGFYAEVTIDGGKMTRPLCLGGTSGFLYLCKYLRSMDELRFAYPATMADYSSIDNLISPINIAKQRIGGSMCIIVTHTISGCCGYIAISSATELLRCEKMILSLSNFINDHAEQSEKKFVDLVTRAKNDYSKLMFEIDMESDLLAIEIITNFNDLFNLVVDATESTAPPAPPALPVQSANITPNKAANKRVTTNFEERIKSVIDNKPPPRKRASTASKKSTPKKARCIDVVVDLIDQPNDDEPNEDADETNRVDEGMVGERVNETNNKGENIANVVEEHNYA